MRNFKWNENLFRKLAGYTNVEYVDLKLLRPIYQYYSTNKVELTLKHLQTHFTAVTCI